MAWSRQAGFMSPYGVTWPILNWRTFAYTYTSLAVKVLTRKPKSTYSIWLKWSRLIIELRHPVEYIVYKNCTSPTNRSNLRSKIIQNSPSPLASSVFHRWIIATRFPYFLPIYNFVLFPYLMPTVLSPAIIGDRHHVNVISRIQFLHCWIYVRCGASFGVSPKNYWTNTSVADDLRRHDTQVTSLSWYRLLCKFLDITPLPP